ncbi:MAG: sigma-70 family RNA polymerase sigma factor [Anaerolineaceae bacterium]|nr:sigma-70 family RNA polymerase sigma factor [Anaerolineaceae bacterium]
MNNERKQQLQFEHTILPHFDSAYNLARWITGNDQDAEDMVQEAFLRAYQYFTGFQGASSRAWLLTIVRNTCYTWLRQNRSQGRLVELEDELQDDDTESIHPETVNQMRANRQVVRKALEQLPAEFRELIVLRELEEMSYKEIAGVAGIPIGTVMSRLARARQQLKRCLVSMDAKEGSNGL